MVDVAAVPERIKGESPRLIRHIDPAWDTNGNCMNCDRRIQGKYRAELYIVSVGSDGVDRHMAKAAFTVMGESFADAIDEIEAGIGERWEEVKSLAQFADEGGG